MRNLSVNEEIVVITQNGEAKAVLQDIHSCEQTQQTLHLLKLLAIGNQQIEAGQFQAAKGEDVSDIVSYIECVDSVEQSEIILDNLEEALLRLSENPKRGAWTKELLTIGIKEFREIYFKPYRVIYKVRSKVVYVMSVLDGRRDLQRVLERRLLHSNIG